MDTNPPNEFSNRGPENKVIERQARLGEREVDGGGRQVAMQFFWSRKGQQDAA